MGKKSKEWHSTTLTEKEITISGAGVVSFSDPEIAEAVNFANTLDVEVLAGADLVAAANNCRCYNKGCSPK